MNTMHEQLAMFPPVDEKAVRKVLLESKKIQSITGCCKESERESRNGIVQLLPRLNPTEMAKNLKAQQIERALQY
ncbi:hypothetical protein ABE354_19345 [Brevibacillus laterosporus]|uniref:hypothetical protein n=1 Tax=Brevibacillus laterosporus TaxID=1465 RepID=UPI003D1DCDA4